MGGARIIGGGEGDREDTRETIVGARDSRVSVM
jgi:hypothetical protein